MQDNNEKKQRNTKQKQLIYENVSQRCDHPVAEEILNDVRKRNPKISMGTVYRNLAQLCENKEVNHVKVPGGDRFDSRLDEHYHIICVKCGKVSDAPMEYIRENDKIVSEKTGYEILKHSMLFEGICTDCLKKEENSKK